MLHVFLSVRTLLACATFLHGAGAAEWTYTGPHGVANWQISFPVCGKNRQSPINVFEGDVILDKRILPIKYTNYDTTIGLRMTLRNNGHSAAVALSGNITVAIEGGGLPPGSFQAFQFHFHWGANAEVGSEHLISGVAFPLELHIVHFNTKYSNPGLASSKADGLAVLGFLYEVSDEDNINYSGITDSLSLIRKSGAQATIPPVFINSLLPPTFSEFYRYSGSLTTPSCLETVTWTIFKEPIRISEHQLEGFRQLLDSHGHVLVNNFRPVQPLKGRQVTANFNPDIRWSYNEGEITAEQWGQYYSACGGDNQSPINIPTRGSQLDLTLPNIRYHNYNNVGRTPFILINNGHIVEVDISTGNSSISGGGLSEPFLASRLQFHWGSTDKIGSEHTLDHLTYPMEVHIVHHRKSLERLTKAVGQLDGLAVLGFFFRISEKDNPALNPLIESLQAVRTPGFSINLRPFSLDSILPTSKSNYFRYMGSLTSPGCSHGVIWSVFVDTITISSSQLAAFRLLTSLNSDEEEETLPMKDNFRPVQKINNRIITRNFVGKKINSEV